MTHMQTPLRITFRHLEPSAAVSDRIREYVSRLEHFHDDIISCHVVIDSPAGHRSTGAPFEVHIEAALPGKEFSVRSERTENPAHADVYVALRDAFDAAKRLMRDYENTRVNAMQDRRPVSISSARTK
jgi:ribosome-associated translation inhibitor RaiA